MQPEVPLEVPTDAVLDLSVEDVNDDPDNTRKPGQDDDLPALATSMKTVGQQTPVTVRKDLPVNGRTTYTMVAGHRRKMAAKLAGIKTLKAIVLTQPVDPGRKVLGMLADNKARKSLTPAEDVDAIVRAKRENPGLTGRQIADLTGYSEAEVSKCSTVFDDPIAYAALADGRIKSVGDAYDVALAIPDVKLGMIALRAGGGTRAEMKAAAKPKPAEPAGKVDRIRCKIPGTGATVVVSGAGLTLSNMIELLGDLLKLARREAEKGVSATTFQRLCGELAKKG